MARTKGSKNKVPAKTKVKEPKSVKKTTVFVAAEPSMIDSAPSAGFKGPPPDAVRKLVQKLEGYSADQKEIGETANELVAKAVETQYFDKKALSWVRSMWKMAIKKPAEFATSFSHLLTYAEDLGLSDIADNHKGFPLDEPVPQISGDVGRIGNLSIVPKSFEDEHSSAA